MAFLTLFEKNTCAGIIAGAKPPVRIHIIKNDFDFFI
jgi:hypothetical protein